MQTTKKGSVSAGIDKDKITDVCIDDFALKKRMSYGTIMVDICSHRIVDMIDSREYSDVKNWLQTYPNLHIVSRDGSITYHNAIIEAHPEALQISDRFHLLKNLTSYSQDYLKKELKQKIAIPMANAAVPALPSFPASQADKNRLLALKEKYDQAQQLVALGYTKTRICKSLNMDIRAYEKLVSTQQEALDMRFQSKRESAHDEAIQRKMALVNEVRELRQNGFSKREITRRTGLVLQTINRYLDDNYAPVHAACGRKRDGALTPYMEEIDTMAAQGIMSPVILQRIQEKGYTGSSSNLRHYISGWKKHQKHFYHQQTAVLEPKQFLERKHVFQLLYHPIEKLKPINQSQFKALCSNYPNFEKVYIIVRSFKTLLTTKDASLLESWMASVKDLGIRELDSFVEGLKRDLGAVKNAISLPQSNGLVEGSVNKLKVIKRIMYGRCSFDTLKTKTLALEFLHHPN